MLKPCIICYRLSNSQDNYCNQDEIPQNVPKTLNIFFKLLRRHLRLDVEKLPPGAGDSEETGWEVPLETIINAGVICCGDCSKVVESFCELYHKMKSIELQLNWKLENLKDNMSGAQEADGRKNEFKAWTSKQIVDNGDGIGVNEAIRVFLDFKQDLINKCGSKLQTTFPKLAVLKCDNKEEMVEEPLSNNASTSDLAGYHRDKIGSPISFDNDSSSEIAEQHLVKAEGAPLSDSTTVGYFSRPSKTKKILNEICKESDVADLCKVKSEQELPRGEPVQQPSSRFRSIHRCQSCMKTFSNPRKLEAHRQHYHDNEEESADNLSWSDAEEEDASESESDLDDQLVSSDDSASIKSVENDTNQTDEMDLDTSENNHEDSKPTDVTMTRSRQREQNKQKKIKLYCHSAYSKNAWKSHYTLNSETSKHKCNICSKEFLRPIGFQFHYNSVHLKVRFKCNQCEKEFRSKAAYSRHHRDVHLVLRRFECPACHQSFKRGHHLENHSRSCGKPSDSESVKANLTHVVDQNSAIEIKVEISATESQINDLNGNNQQLDHAAHPPPMSGEIEINNEVKGDAFNEQSNMIILSESPKQIGQDNLQNSFNPWTGKYNCSQCSNKFTTRGGLSLHYRTIHLKRRFKCGLCGKQFHQRSLYRRHHENVHRGVGSFTCGICNQKFKHRYYLYNHAKMGTCKSLQSETMEDQDGRKNSEHDQPPEAKFAEETSGFPTVIENSPASPKEVWIKHCITDSKTGGTKCSICPKEFKSSVGFRRHYESVHLKKTFQCTLCNQQFRARSSYNRHHQDIHLNVKSFMCSNCNLTFKRSHHLAKHQLTTSCRNNAVITEKEGLGRAELKLQEHVCNQCDKKFATLDILKNHVKTIHSQPVVCEHCGKEFTQRDGLASHIKRIHQNPKKKKEKVKKKKKEEKVVCDQCGNVLSSAWNLRIHVQEVHLKIRLRGQRVCDQCGKVLANSKSLISHKKYVHWNLREHACDFCDKRFVETRDLKKHLQSMHPDRSESELN